jgi:hypothetical protein
MKSRPASPLLHLAHEAIGKLAEPTASISWLLRQTPRHHLGATGFVVGCGDAGTGAG